MNNDMIALALLADTQVARAVHEADEARADARARQEEKRRLEAAERARREEAARRQWESYDARHRRAAEKVRSADSGIVGGSILAGVLSLALMLAGAWICTTLRLVFPSTYEEPSYYFAVNGIGHAINNGLWIMVLLAIACGLVARWVPIVTWLTVPAIGWIVYESAPAGHWPDGIGEIFSDIVLDLGMVSVLLFSVLSPGLLWLLAVTSAQAGRAQTARRRLAGARAALQEIESSPPSDPRPRPGPGRPS